MAGNFWTHQYDLPAGTGYEHWSRSHLLSILVIASAIAVCLKCSARIKEWMKSMIPPVLAVMEISKDLYLHKVGHFGPEYLPLHLCGIGILVFLFAVYGGRWRSFFTEIAMILILPGSICAILFPDWNMYPVWNFMNLYSWTWHGFLVLFPLLNMNWWKPEIKNIWKPLVFLSAIVPPVYLFDRRYGCNYLFINWPPEGTPLIWIAGILGVPGYLAGYALLTLVVMVVMYYIYGSIYM